MGVSLPESFIPHFSPMAIAITMFVFLAAAVGLLMQRKSTNENEVNVEKKAIVPSLIMILCLGLIVLSVVSSHNIKEQSIEALTTHYAITNIKEKDSENFSIPAKNNEENVTITLTSGVNKAAVLKHENDRLILLHLITDESNLVEVPTR